MKGEGDDDGRTRTHTASTETTNEGGCGAEVEMSEAVERGCRAAELSQNGALVARKLGEAIYALRFSVEL